MKTGALYIRVSTEEQTEYSPDAQKRALLDYAKKNKIFISSDYIFIDEGISGRIAEKRPGFMQMIKTAKQKPKPFDVILVHKFDRFSRSREDSVVYKSLLKKECGIKVISITEQLEDDKFSIILESMLEAMAEYYSLNLSDEVKKGMTEKAKKGGLQTGAAFGYEVKEKGLLKM
jgi:DNA invertase Pin-like site-specific DNA recombinase